MSGTDWSKIHPYSTRSRINSTLWSNNTSPQQQQQKPIMIHQPQHHHQLSTWTISLLITCHWVVCHQSLNCWILVIHQTTKCNNWEPMSLFSHHRRNNWVKNVEMVIKIERGHHLPFLNSRRHPPSNRPSPRARSGVGPCPHTLPRVNTAAV